MNYSHEKIYHFTFEECSLWWSIAGTNKKVEKKPAWYCPWCGHEHRPDHKDITLRA